MENRGKKREFQRHLNTKWVPEINIKYRPLEWEQKKDDHVESAVGGLINS